MLQASLAWQHTHLARIAGVSGTTQPGSHAHIFSREMKSQTFYELISRTDDFIDILFLKDLMGDVRHRFAYVLYGRATPHARGHLPSV